MRKGTVSGVYWLLFLSLVLPTVSFAETIYWRNKAPMPTARSHPLSAVVDGYLYVLGGKTGTGIPPTGIIDTVERYNPLTDTWQTMPPLAVPRTSACSVVQGKNIYIVGGGASAPPTST